MNKIKFLIKKSDKELLDCNILELIYTSLNHKYITLIYGNEKYVCVGKYENYIEFIDDFYSELKPQYNVLVCFHDEKNNFFTDYKTDKLFYKTKNKISVFSEEIDFLDEVCSLDILRFKPLFDMFIENNHYVEITFDKLFMYGEYVDYKGYFINFEINNEFSENNTSKNLDGLISEIEIEKENEKCYFCKKDNVQLTLVNNSIYVCKYCNDVLFSKPCYVCGGIFTPKYMKNNICISCLSNKQFDKNKLFVENSIAMAYLNCIIDPNCNVIKKMNIKELQNIVKDKDNIELLKLRYCTDKWLKDHAYNLYKSEINNLMYDLFNEIKECR